MPNHTSNHPDTTQLDDAEFIDLAAVWDSFKLHWRIILACVIAAAVASALALTLPQKWEAAGTLQIGQLPVSAITLIEPTNQAAERFKQRQLQDQALNAAGLPLNEDSDVRTRLFRKTLKATAGKNTDFVDVRAAGFSRSEAETNLNAAVKALIDTHNMRSAPMIKNLDARLQNNALQMAQATPERNRLDLSLKNASAAGAKFEPSVVAINLLAKQEELIRSLTTEQASLVEVRTRINAFPTMLVDAIFVPEKPYFPKLSVFLAVGLFIGAIAGSALALFLDRNRGKAKT
jgi:LPS O-antigen subunit length determinant protein (WzzB/FepE family)